MTTQASTNTSNRTKKRRPK